MRVCFDVRRTARDEVCCGGVGFGSMFAGGRECLSI